MAQSKAKSPNGWENYRQNLIVLYDDVRAGDDSLEDRRITQLIKETDYQPDTPRPGFLEQWAALNEIEHRLFRLIDDTVLIEQVKRKFEAAEKEGVGRVAERRAAFEATLTSTEPDAPARRRAIAFALLDDLFVQYSYRFTVREKRMEVSRRLTRIGVGLIGIPVVLLFLWPFVDIVADWVNGEQGTSPTPAPGSLLGVDTEDEPEIFRWASREYAAFFVVMYFGIVGAFFSRLFIFARDLRSLTWKEMDGVYSTGALWVRLLTGAIAAVIVFFLMMGKILSGALFINGDFALWVLDGQGDPMIPLRPTEDFARLVLWCTLSGFSERFLPDRLKEIDDSAAKSGSEAASKPRS